MLRVQDVMTKDVLTVNPETSAENAWDTMRMKCIHHLVVTKDSQVVGLFSDRDAGGRQGATVRKGRTVGDLMTKNTVTVQPATPVRKAANLMHGRSIGSLVVIDDGRVVGIVTVADLLELLGRGLERPAAATKRWTLRHRVPHRKRHQAAATW